MKNLAALLLLGSLGLGGCEFVAGAATGALATGAGMRSTPNGRWIGSKMITAVSASVGESMNVARTRLSAVRSSTETWIALWQVKY